jgi:transcriptional/translational regulatory protein YebC/TACO1
MAGHNNWSKINRTKGALDVKRGNLFSRLSKELTVATRLGEGNPAFHPGRRAANSAARAEFTPHRLQAA